MNDLDELFTITCGRCHTTAPVDAWQRTPVAGDTPADTYQCPACHLSFRRQPKPHRQPWDKFVELVPADPSL